MKKQSKKKFLLEKGRKFKKKCNKNDLAEELTRTNFTTKINPHSLKRLCKKDSCPCLD